MAKVRYFNALSKNSGLNNLLIVVKGRHESSTKLLVHCDGTRNGFHHQIYTKASCSSSQSPPLNHKTWNHSKKDQAIITSFRQFDKIILNLFDILFDDMKRCR